MTVSGRGRSQPVTSHPGRGTIVRDVEYGGESVSGNTATTCLQLKEAGESLPIF